MKKWFWSILAGLAAIVFLHQPAMSATYYVPDDYLTIQGAVNAAWGGRRGHCPGWHLCRGWQQKHIHK